MTRRNFHNGYDPDDDPPTVRFYRQQEQVNDHGPHCYGMCCLAKSGPIRDEAEDWRELWQMTGGEAGGA